MTSSKSTKRRKLEAELQKLEEELLDNIIEETALYENESQSIEPELSDDTESEHSNFKQQFSSTNKEIDVNIFSEYQNDILETNESDGDESSSECSDESDVSENWHSSIPDAENNFEKQISSSNMDSIDNDDKISIKHELSNWAVKHNITQNAISDLLKMLNGHSCFKNELPI